MYYAWVIDRGLELWCGSSHHLNLRQTWRTLLPGPAGAKLQLPQQWGVWFIAASVALVVVVAEGFCVAVAQLATGSRLRAAQDAARAANVAAEERNRAAEERERAARSDRVQARALRAGALVWLEPSVLHRRFLALIAAELAQLAATPA
jgi:hypothetical protein